MGKGGKKASQRLVLAESRGEYSNEQLEKVLIASRKIPGKIPRESRNLLFFRPLSKTVHLDLDSSVPMFIGREKGGGEAKIVKIRKKKRRLLSNYFDN